MTPHSNRRFGLAASALALSVVLLAGCSGPRVQGDVTLDGKPVDGGTITLFSEGGPNQRTNVSGEIKDGKYALQNSPNLTPGKYRVEIYWHKKTGRRVLSNDPPNKVNETVQVIPKQYNVDSSTEVEVKSGTNTLNFDLKSKGR